MANKRQFKKHVHNVCGDLFADCVALTMCGGDNREMLERLMAETLALNNEFTARACHVEPNDAKAYFKHNRADFDAKAEEIFAKIVKA